MDGDERKKAGSRRSEMVMLVMQVGGQRDQFFLRGIQLVGKLKASVDQILAGPGLRRSAGQSAWRGANGALARCATDIHG